MLELYSENVMLNNNDDSNSLLHCFVGTRLTVLKSSFSMLMLLIKVQIAKLVKSCAVLKNNYKPLNHHLIPASFFLMQSLQAGLTCMKGKTSQTNFLLQSERRVLLLSFTLKMCFNNKNVDNIRNFWVVKNMWYI